MRGDSFTLGPRSSSEEELAGILNRALARPSAITQSDLLVVETALSESHPEPVQHLALSVITAVSYSRPDLVLPGFAGLLRPILQSPRTSIDLGIALSRTLNSLLFTPEPNTAVAVVLDALERGELPGQTRTELLRTLHDVVQWRPDLLNLGALIALAERVEDDAERSFILDYIVERLSFAAPQQFRGPALSRLIACFGKLPRFKYLLAFLDSGPAPVGCFPLRDTASRVLCRPSFQLLVVVNSAFGQGDEIARTVPVLQAIVDANPNASIVILSRRGFLYDHPQCRQLSILDDAEVDQALNAVYDGVIHFSEPVGAHFNLRPLVEAAVGECIRRSNPRFLLRGNHADHSFTFQRVVLDGRELATDLDFDQPLLTNLYEPSLRLLVEFGLPFRIGTKNSLTPSILIADASSDADHLWSDLVPGGGERRVALVNPFGGSVPSKGYIRRHFDQLAAELAGLVEEGYHLILVCNGMPWGGVFEAEDVLRRLPAAVNLHISIAPDPGEKRRGRQRVLHERAELSYAGKVMRLYKYLAVRADLIVTVEGWMSHLAFNLGKPFRLVLMPGFPGYRWLPHARGPDQRIVTEMSPLAKIDYATTDLLDGSAEAPVPRWYRKQMLAFVVESLGRLDQSESVPLRVRALASPDPDLRQLALASLELDSKTSASELVAALSNKSGAARIEIIDAAARFLWPGLSLQRIGARGIVVNSIRWAARLRLAAERWGIIAPGRHNAL